MTFHPPPPPPPPHPQSYPHFLVSQALFLVSEENSTSSGIVEKPKKDEQSKEVPVKKQCPSNNVVPSTISYKYENGAIVATQIHSTAASRTVVTKPQTLQSAVSATLRSSSAKEPNVLKIITPSSVSVAAKPVSNLSISTGVSTPNKSASSTSISTTVSIVNKSLNSAAQQPSQTKVTQYFKLGMEKTYESYVNQFSSNPLAKNKQQINEERDRRRGISTKFNLGEYTYTGSLVGNLERLLLTLRCSVVTLETSIPSAFMHPMWPLQRSTWVKAVHISKTSSEFASVLAFLESFIKPVIMRSVWSDAVGHLKLFRTLSESKSSTLTKKTSKEEEEELHKKQMTCKFNITLFHRKSFRRMLINCLIFNKILLKNSTF